MASRLPKHLMAALGTHVRAATAWVRCANMEPFAGLGKKGFPCCRDHGDGIPRSHHLPVCWQQSCKRADQHPLCPYLNQEGDSFHFQIFIQPGCPSRMPSLLPPGHNQHPNLSPTPCGHDTHQKQPWDTGLKLDRSSSPSAAHQPC